MGIDRQRSQLNHSIMQKAVATPLDYTQRGEMSHNTVKQKHIHYTTLYGNDTQSHIMSYLSILLCLCFFIILWAESFPSLADDHRRRRISMSLSYRLSTTSPCSAAYSSDRSSWKWYIYTNTYYLRLPTEGKQLQIMKIFFESILSRNFPSWHTLLMVVFYKAIDSLVKICTSSFQAMMMMKLLLGYDFRMPLNCITWMPARRALYTRPMPICMS